MKTRPSSSRCRCRPSVRPHFRLVFVFVCFVLFFPHGIRSSATTPSRVPAGLILVRRCHHLVRTARPHLRLRRRSCRAEGATRLGRPLRLSLLATVAAAAAGASLWVWGRPTWVVVGAGGGASGQWVLPPSTSSTTSSGRSSNNTTSVRQAATASKFFSDTSPISIPRCACAGFGLFWCVFCRVINVIERDFFFLVLVLRPFFVCSLMVRMIHTPLLHTPTRSWEKLRGVRVGGCFCCSAERFRVICSVQIIHAVFFCLPVWLLACRFVRLFFGVVSLNCSS